MGKTEATEKLEKAIQIVTSKMGTFGCLEVTIGFGGTERVDYMTVDTKGIWRCYEIKISVADFRSKAKKTFCGHYNYFVMTKELYEKVKSEIPDSIGVYAGTAHYDLKCVKKPKKQELLIDETVLYMSMIRSLNREAEKLQKLENPKAIEHYNRQISSLTAENRRVYDDNTRLRNALFRKYGRNWQEVIGL